MNASTDSIVTELRPNTVISFAADLAQMGDKKKVSKKVGRFTFQGRKTIEGDGANHSTSGLTRYVKIPVLTGEQAAEYGLSKRVRIGFYIILPKGKSDSVIKAFGLELLTLLQASIKACADGLPEAAASVKAELYAILGAETAPVEEAVAVEATAEPEEAVNVDDLHEEPKTTPKRGSSAAKAANNQRKGSTPRAKAKK